MRFSLFCLKDRQWNNSVTSLCVGVFYMYISQRESRVLGYNYLSHENTIQLGTVDSSQLIIIFRSSSYVDTLVNKTMVGLLPSLDYVTTMI